MAVKVGSRNEETTARNTANRSPEILESSLAASLKKLAEDEGICIPAEIPSDIFKFLVEELHAKYNQTVVVLIDEYDKPILDRLGDIQTAEANKDVLGGSIKRGSKAFGTPAVRRSS